MEQFGYVCSVYCRQQAEAKRMVIPVYKNQKSVVAGRSNAMAKRITIAVVALVAVLLGLYIWYTWFAREPKIVYSLSIPKLNPDNPRSFSRPEEFYDLIGPGQLLSIKSKQVTLFDVAGQRQIWSAPLRADTEKSTSDSQDDEGSFYFAEPRAIATSNDVWIAMADKLLRFDRQTGNPKDTGIKGKILNLIVNSDNILAVAGGAGGSKTLARISLPDGNIQTEEIASGTVSKPEPVAPVQSAAKSKGGKTKAGVAPKGSQIPVAQLKNLATQNQPAPAVDTNSDASDAFDEFSFREPFIAAGPNAVEMKTKLLEKKVISHQAMKAKGKSVLDDSNLNASQGLEVAQEMMNDSRRQETGGVELEDVSRFQVTLHRHFQKDAADWTAEVTGPPQFFPLKTVDALVAGQGLIVLDKQNKKLWEAKLTFPVVHHFSMRDEERAPCVETKDALYFADAGTLTRFDLASGTVRWRYNTVGITRVLADERGGIYIVTSTASPEQIQYSQQINLRDKVKPVVMKLDAASGKVKWRQEAVGEELMRSGKFLYATRVSMTYALLRLEEGPDTHYNLNLLDPSSGDVIWNFHRGNRRVIKTEVQNNWILLHMEDEVVVLKFFSL